MQADAVEVARQRADVGRDRHAVVVEQDDERRRRPREGAGAGGEALGQLATGAFKTAIPAEPPAQGPLYAQVPWTTATPPWVTVGFHGPAFSTTDNAFVALDTLMDLTFGPTSDLYKRLVEQEQKVDQLFTFTPQTADPQMMSVFARVKDAKDAVYVRSEIEKAFAQARTRAVPAPLLEDAKSNARYSLSHTFDSTEHIAATLARYVRFRRQYGTLNAFYRLQGALTPADLQAAAQKYFTDAGLVVTTLAQRPLARPWRRSRISTRWLAARPCPKVSCGWSSPRSCRSSR